LASCLLDKSQTHKLLGALPERVQITCQSQTVIQFGSLSHNIFSALYIFFN